MSEITSLAELREALFNRTDDDTTLRASVGAWMSPIANKVTALQDAGRDIYIWGFTSDESHALIVDKASGWVTVAHVNTANSLGRWECSVAHLGDYTDVYWPRFPKR